MNEPDILVEETYGVTSRRVYRLSHFVPMMHIKEENKQWQSLTKFSMDVFLPHGYPDSVSKDYFQYQVWDSIQAFASSITGSICTHAVLKAVGVGDENATPLAATITWLIKDGTSMVGRIAFAWLQGTKLDSECKKWRLFADILNDIAMFLDLMSAHFQSYSMLIICISGLCKSLVGVAGGSTRAALTQHQARKNNMADVSAKDGSQETLVNLLALICSLIIVPIVTKSLVLTWITYIAMTFIHVLANYFAIKAVVMETFNSTRFKIYTEHYLTEGATERNFLTVTEVNKRESVFFSLYQETTKINLGSSFKDIISDRRPEEIVALLDLYKSCDYILSVSKRNLPNIVINIAFNRKATAVTQIEAFYQAYFLKFTLGDSYVYLEGNKDTVYFESMSREYTMKTFSDFKNSLKTRGFRTDIAVFDTEMWRVEW